MWDDAVALSAEDDVDAGRRQFPSLPCLGCLEHTFGNIGRFVSNTFRLQGGKAGGTHLLFCPRTVVMVIPRLVS